MQEKKIDEDIKVSIIVRSFNEERHIGKLFHELFQQETSFRFEIIVVDSGSTDATLDIVGKFNEVNIVQISPDDFSFGYSLNKGIENAHGKYCVFISAHCYPVNKVWLQKLIEPFNDKKVYSDLVLPAPQLSESSLPPTQLLSRSTQPPLPLYTLSRVS